MSMQLDKYQLGRQGEVPYVLLVETFATGITASFPGSPYAQTASDGKLGGAWEQGYCDQKGSTESISFF